MIPSFSLESFESEESEGGTESVIIDENGCVLLPSKKRVKKRGSPAVSPEESKEGGTPTEKKEDLHEKIALLEKEAYEKGFAQGQKDGQALEKIHMEEKSKHLETLVGELANLKEAIFRETEAEMVRLSVAIAKKIIRNELRTGNHRIEETIRAASKFLVDASQVRIKISPEDMEQVTELIPTLAAGMKAGRIQVLEDHSVHRGGCILQTGFGNVNASFEDQMAAVETEIERVLNSNGADVS